MLNISVLLFKVLVVPFYKLNSGFFLFVFLLLFGIMNAREVMLYHTGLMQTIVASGVGMGIAMTVWFLYNYKCIRFVIASLDKPENNFLSNMQGLSVGKQIGLFLFCQFLLFLPVLLYAGITIKIGFSNGYTSAALTILSFLLLLCVGSAVLYFRKLNSYHKQGLTLNLQLPFATKYTKPPVLYIAFHLLQERKLALLGVKFFSSFIFYLVFVLHRHNFSLGYFRLLFLIATIVHSMLVFYSFRFVETQMAFSRNLPITRVKRLLTYIYTYLFLLLPEFCWLLLYSDGLMTWADMLTTLTTGLSQLLLLTAILYLPRTDLQRFALYGCLVYIVSAILLPSGIAFVLFLQTALALLIFYRNYYSFEANPTHS